MSKGIVIAVSGKGGVGKTSLSALLIRSLARRGSVLALDADPDSNLPQALGAAVGKEVGSTREAIVNAPARSEVAADRGSAFEQALHEIVTEGDDFDLVVMGRSEGEGCYCAINHILRQVLDTKVQSYDFTVVDCEAGLEHLSRRTTRDVDLMIAVSDATPNGMMTAKRVQELSKELCVSFGEMVLVVNRVTGETRSLAERLARENGLEATAYVPYDPQLALLEARARPVVELPEDSPASLAVTELCERILAYSLA